MARVRKEGDEAALLASSADNRTAMAMHLLPGTDSPGPHTDAWFALEATMPGLTGAGNIPQGLGWPMDLGFNQLSGRVPTEFGNKLLTLRNLTLQNNNLIGTHPSATSSATF
ncbi:hypothetical protein HU200_006925 [Digitaria exilis]|uniref:Uncharacterized protein n=1 Tax=Digitaria exilis TaxID=1010633 RepID=A0A835KV39_9POAL|nr:hypothetical protein HU200_006925 [Digitaria exilis]